MVNIRGSVKVTSIPDSACFTTFADLLRALGTYLSVEIPDQTFSNIIISAEQPGAADVNKIWWQLGSSGTFLALRTWDPNTQTWVSLFPSTKQIFWFAGDSDNPPAGFKLLEAADNYMPAPDYANLIANQALPAGSTPPFSYFPCIFVGF